MLARSGGVVASRNIFSAPGRITALIVLGVLTALRIINPLPVEELRLRVFDLEQRFAPRPYQPVAVRIVAIDETSLAKYGQWPWPRSLLAQLVGKIAQGQPSVLGVDIIFAEPDRFSPQMLVREIPDIPPQIARELEAMPSNDTLLGDAFRQVPTVLAVSVGEHPVRAQGFRARLTPIREKGRDPRPFLLQFPPPLRSLPEITQFERGRGSDIAAPDPDGVVRRIPLFVMAEGNLLPALALEMLRVASGAGSVDIVTGRLGVRGATVGNVFLPTDHQGRAYPYFTPSEDPRYISASDILDSTYDVSSLRGAAVLLGVTSLGLMDERETPLGLMPGGEIHAQLVESMLTGNLLRRPAILNSIEIALVMLVGLLTIFAVPYRRPSTAIAVVTAVAVVLLVGEFASFRLFKVLFSTIYPALSTLAVFGVMLGSNLRAAESARRRLADALDQERRMEARIEGELKAAAAIQMGLLPRQFPESPQHRDVEMYAFIEPAREVGGDLYDFLFLDADRLAFVIADVAGKGVPAALFMAMTREVIRGAMQRYGEQLDRVFAEANAKVSASSADMAAEGADMMFVTVFVGVIDLNCGMLSYVNAGHDWPILLGKDTRATVLSGDSGTPLGALDDFHYPVQRRQLAPGDVLLLYTDGVTEAQDSARSFYGEGRLKQALARPKSLNPKAIVESVHDDVRRFVGRAAQFDDITLLAVRWLGREPSPDF
ncbi:MAG TPA: CHASE2 domain-containing protein [Candidatus Binataceae bacterium]|nr:CHASE2 domain-containing protein [Candidatus Binataceae bacterium]